MKMNLRMCTWSLLLLGSFFLSAHPEILEFNLTPHVYNIPRNVVREGVATDHSWAILRVAFPLDKIPHAKVQNINRSLRAFFYNDALYVEQHDPREVYLISGNFWTESFLKNIYFSEAMTLVVRGETVSNGVPVPILLRVQLNEGTIEII